MRHLHDYSDWNTLAAMNLDRLLSREEWTEERLAAAVRKLGLSGTNQSTINRLRQKTRRASLELSLAIEAACGGLVRAEDLPLSKRTRRALKGVRELSHLTQRNEGAAA